eukprot:TRINITY_DN16205_c0_g2_i1.p1 TRINITY_DN16205_c0_g2~~TRINITY_DN16205_c0_g2_i1.p1  ORF type:complete len:111 (-),score=5.78 TRINITY_DN16205_c0_g2_i1:243-575(-)
MTYALIGLPHMRADTTLFLQSALRERAGKVQFNYLKQLPTTLNGAKSSDIKCENSSHVPNGRVAKRSPNIYGALHVFGSSTSSYLVLHPVLCIAQLSYYWTFTICVPRVQ